MRQKEGVFKAEVHKELKHEYKGCIIAKLDANDIQGIPDTIILYGDRWASLEFKRSASASVRPNQQYYVDKMNKMSFSRFIYPENRKGVLDDLRKALRV